MTIRPLVRSIRQLNEREASGELAFLCLNGKSENHIRDLVAFNIARRHMNWTIRREINGLDLVIVNTRGDKLAVEFKIGYAGGVLYERERSAVLRGALADIRKRPYPIVNCIGIMDFECDDYTQYAGCRNSGLIRRTAHDNFSPREIKHIIDDIWPNSERKYIFLRCGKWNDVTVTILFAILRHELIF